MTQTVCIIGLGYIGLPTAAMFASHGKKVIGVDISERVVRLLNSGTVHIEETGLTEIVLRTMADGSLIVRSAPQPADAFIISVPTPIQHNKAADLAAVRAAAESVSPFVKRGTLVILESTSPPGTTQNVVRPILEQNGLKAGTDFLLAYSPERVLPGQILKEMVEDDRVIGGIDAKSAAAGKELYSSFVRGEIHTTEATTAEMVKLMENTFRDVNIALANEFALIAEKLSINVWDAIKIANCHPRVKILTPGPGVGGHCIAVDPWFLVECAPEQAKLIRQARLVNDGMPEHVIERVQELLAGKSDAVVACLGATYKANVDDKRESPAIEIINQLAASGIRVRLFDPHLANWQSESVTIANSLQEAVAGTDLVLLLVDHNEFRGISDAELSSMRSRVILDTRNCLHAGPLRAAGFSVSVLGGAG